MDDGNGLQKNADKEFDRAVRKQAAVVRNQTLAATLVLTVASWFI